ncbi:MAG: helix-turn-helix domain-containing protein [Desulfovibrionaceae bacterium]|nr:helix-turn-helix domain-containing protein [Desulfovibrionaceae bacterium]
MNDKNTPNDKDDITQDKIENSPYRDVFKRIGVRIRNRRNELELSQDELARRTGLSVRFLVSLEGGKTNISLTTLISLCEALNLSIFEILTKEKDRAEVIKDITHALNSLTTDDLDGVRNLILHIYKSRYHQQRNSKKP